MLKKKPADVLTSLYPREGNSPSGLPRLPCERDFDAEALPKPIVTAPSAGGEK
jgi:hypothetical protein